MPKSEKKKIDRLPSALERAHIAAKVAEENKGQDVVILDLRDVTKAFDFFLLITGTSRRQLHAIADEIQKKMVELGDEHLTVAGHTEARWMVIDYGDLVVHLFEPETRVYYALEELWGNTKKIERIN